MTGGKAFLEDLQRILIYMHDTSGLDAKAISNLTGIPLRTIYRFLSTWKRTGKVKPAPEGQRGRPRILDFADTQVSSLLSVALSSKLISKLAKVLQCAVTRRNDRYLEELREVLEERCGVKVSDSTIWRTLHRVVFRLKEVRVVSSPGTSADAC